MANVVLLNSLVLFRIFRSSSFREFSPPHLPNLISSISPSSLLPPHVQHILQMQVAMLLSGLGNYCRLTSPFSPLRGASSARGKGHEEGGLAYTKAGSSLRSLPGNSRASTPKTRVCLLSALCSHLHL